MARRTVWFERRFWFECAAFCGLLLCWMYVGPTSGMSRYLPPKLDINASYIDITPNSSLRITCYGRHPVAWALPPLGDNVSLRSSVSEESVDGLLPFKSVFELNTTDVMDQGRYTCYYNATTDRTNTGNATSIYIFVNDDYYLFQPQKQKDQLVSVTMRHGELSVVPCLPTHSGAKVQLWKDLGQGEMEEVLLLSDDVEFDPMRGFIIYYPEFYEDGRFVCNGSVPGRVYKYASMAMDFVYLPPVDIAPKVFFDKGINFDPEPNGSFTLNCTVTVQAGVNFNMSWDYPNKNSSHIRVRKLVYEIKPFGQKRFRLFVVTSQLRVPDVQRSAEGLYTCSCTDHGGKTYNDSVFVYVYAEPVVAVLNDTELFAYGANVTLVCMVKGSDHLLVSWQWRECVEPRSCNEHSPSGVFETLWAHGYHKNGPGDGTPLVHSARGMRHENLTLRLRAQQSGLYRCVGSNWLGKDMSVAKFYVTDAKNGLEIFASDAMPVDQQKVWLSCLANKFKYENLTWQWKAEGSAKYISLNASDALEINMSSTKFSNNLTLYFNPIGRNQSGHYKCIGAPRVGNSHRHEFVNITVRGKTGCV